MDTNKAGDFASLKSILRFARLWVAPLLVASTFVVAVVIENFHLADTSKYPIIKQLSEVALPALILELFLYLMFERIFEIEPIAQGVEKLLPSADLILNIPSIKQLDAMLENTRRGTVSELREPLEVEVFTTPEAIYRAVVDTVERVEGQKPDVEKTLHHAVFYSSEPVALPPVAPTEPEYFTRFKDKMRQCVESRGRSRWTVKSIYNVSSLERFRMISDRCQWGDEGFELYAVFMPESITPMSPMIVDEEDVFLAFFEASNYRVNSGIHIRNRAVTAFFIAHFAEAWNFQLHGVRNQPVFRLRKETGVQQRELQRLESTISRWSAK